MTIITVEFLARPDTVDKLLAYFAETLPDTRASNGCEDVTMHQDQDNPARLLVIEQWKSRQHYLSYLAWREESGTLEPANALVAQPPTLRFFDVLQGV